MEGKIKKAIEEVQRDTLLPNRFLFVQYTRFERVNYNKLKLLAFVENQSCGALLRDLTTEAIKNYEKKNGSLVKLAREALKDEEVS